MSLPSLPTLPFTVVIEPPTRSELRGGLRRPSFWVVLVAVLAAVGLLVANRVGERRHPAASAALTVSSVPPGARVVVDGRSIAVTPASLSVPAASHQIQLRKPGYADADYQLRLTPGSSAAVVARLWLSHPTVIQLRPAVPGTKFGGARFLNDGRLAITALFDSGRQQAWVMDANGHSQSAGGTAPSAHEAISADGRLLAFATTGGTAGQSTRATQVFVTLVTGSNPTTNVYAVDASSQDDIADLSWAPDGQHLLAGVTSHDSADTQTRLLWLDPAGGQARLLAETPGALIAQSETWMPTGRAVAFLVRTQSSTALCLMQLPGGELHDLAETSGSSTPLPFASITWVPDGRHVLYQAGEPSSSGGLGWFSSKPDMPLFRANLDGSGAERLHARAAEFPLWRQDGSLVGWSAQGSGKPLSLVAINGPSAGRSLADLPVQGGSQFAARWDEQHDQALVAIASGFGDAKYFLVRFAPEDAR